LVAAVRKALDRAAEELDDIQLAQREQALVLAAIVEERSPSSVPASRELRAVLSDLSYRWDEDVSAFLRDVQVPIPQARGGGDG
jgi:hypothetical protein